MKDLIPRWVVLLIGVIAGSVCADGNDSSTVLLIHSDGGSVFEDSSVAGGHTITAHGDVNHSTTRSVFGSTSIAFDGSGDYLSIPASNDWNLGTGDYTIDFWISLSAATSGVVQNILGVYDTNSNRSWWFQKYADGRLHFNSATDAVGGHWGGMFATWSPAADTWYHIAVVRNGVNSYAFINGSQVANWSSQDVFDSTAELQIGRTAFAGAAGNVNGYIDELRVSKGVARWTSTFTPPSMPYDTGSVGCNADYNNDGVINHLDISDRKLDKQLEMLTEQKNWTNTCWKTSVP